MRSLFSWKLGRIAGIDVYLHFSLLIFALFAFSSEGGVWEVLLYGLTFACVLAHEYGHALTARELYGIRTRDITLYPIGGVASLERLPRGPGPEFLVTFAGPLVNVAIAAVLYLGFYVGLIDSGVNALGEVRPLAVVLERLMWINAGLAVFNLLPVFPMDGGRILRALLNARLGRLRATEIAVNLGQTAAIVGGIYFLLNGVWLGAIMAWFLHMAAGAELNQVRYDEWMRRSGGQAGFGPFGGPFAGFSPVVIHVRQSDPRR